MARISNMARTKKSSKVQQFASALVAAAEQALPASGGSAATSTASQAWHRAVYAYARTVPELGAAKLYVGNCMAQIGLRTARRHPDGSVEPAVLVPAHEEEGDDGETILVPAELAPGIDPQVFAYAEEVIATLRAPYGGQSGLLRSYGEKIFLAGDTWLLPVDSSSGLTFDACSTTELVKEGTGYKRLYGPGGESEDIPETTIPVRVWRPDPEFGRLSCSSVQACLEVLEELVILTRLVRSAAIQRLALSGILAIADDFDDPIDDAGEDGQTAEQMNPLAHDIIETGAVAIDDPSSAAAWLPYLLQGPLAAVKEGIRLIRFEGDDALNVVKRGEALDRLAHGIDLPAESVLGHGDTTFANANQISEDRFKIHIEPSVQMFCDAVTVNILWPALALKMGLAAERVRESGYPPEITALAVGYDADNLVARPNQAKEQLELFKADQSQTAVKISEVRNAVGLDPDEQVDEEETMRRIGYIRMVKGPAPEPGMPVEEGELEEVPLEEDGTGTAAALASALQITQRIAGAMEVTVERAAGKIGSKLREKASAAQKGRVQGRANTEVARVLGPTITAKLLSGSDPAAADVADLMRSVVRWATELGCSDPHGLAKAVGEVTATAIHDRLYATTSIEPRSLLELVGKHAAQHQDERGVA